MATPPPAWGVRRRRTAAAAPDLHHSTQCRPGSLLAALIACRMLLRSRGGGGRCRGRLRAVGRDCCKRYAVLHQREFLPSFKMTQHANGSGLRVTLFDSEREPGNVCS